MADERTTKFDQLRAAGFTSEALSYPRDEVALRLLCAFNGVDWKSAPPGWWYHPNESSKAAWRRVADAAQEIFGADWQALALRHDDAPTKSYLSEIFDEPA